MIFFSRRFTLIFYDFLLTRFSEIIKNQRKSAAKKLLNIHLHHFPILIQNPKTTPLRYI